MYRYTGVDLLLAIHIGIDIFIWQHSNVIYIKMQYILPKVTAIFARQFYIDSIHRHT